MVMLEGMEMYSKALTTIMDLYRSYYQYKAEALVEKNSNQYGNLGTKKLHTHTLQATAILQTLLKSTCNHMLYKSKTKENGEKVVAMFLFLSFH